jgi:hypothetical protein
LAEMLGLFFLPVQNLYQKPIFSPHFSASVCARPFGFAQRVLSSRHRTDVQRFHGMPASKTEECCVLIACRQRGGLLIPVGRRSSNGPQHHLGHLWHRRDPDRVGRERRNQQSPVSAALIARRAASGTWRNAPRPRLRSG